MARTSAFRFVHSSGWLCGLALLSLTVAGCGRGRVTKLDQARTLLGEGKTDAAIQLCDELLANTEKNVDAVLLRGEGHQKNGNLSAARDDFDLAIEWNRQNANAYYYRYHLALAEAERLNEGSEEKRKKLLEANGFRRLFEGYSPEAMVAGLHDALPSDTQAIIADVPSITDSQGESSPAVPDAQRITDASPWDAEAEPEDEKGVPAQDQELEDVDEDYIAKRRREIQRRDLGEEDELPEATLPPHQEPEAEEITKVPAPPVVRFDLPSAWQPMNPTGSATRPHTTGYVATQPTSPEVTGPAVLLPHSTGIVPRQATSTNGPLVRSPFVTLNAPRSTGIRSGGPRQADFLQRGGRPLQSPWFGSPRTAARVRDQRGNPDESAEEPEAERPVQIISSALPNSAPPAGTPAAALGSLPVNWYQPNIPTTGSWSLER